MITGFKHYLIGSLALLGGACLSAPASADGRADEGRKLGYTCLGCHGIEGYRNAYPSYRVPKLGGQKSAYIELALREYRDGKRPHPTMQAQGSSLTEQDIEDLAAYFQGEEPALDPVTLDSVAGIDAAKACVACHGADGASVIPPPPTLSGQQQEYLVHALGQYKKGERPGTVMSAFAGSLSADDIAAIAKFYSRLEGLKTPDRDE